MQRVFSAPLAVLLQLQLPLALFDILAGPVVVSFTDGTLQAN